MNAENNHKTESGMKVWQSIETPITVALIDDGVDITQLELDAAPLISGRTFCTRDEVKHLSHPHYASSTGHGTHMAQSIHAICPRAQFFILRLEDYPSEDGSSRHITAKSAAQVRYWLLNATSLPRHLTTHPIPLSPVNKKKRKKKKKNRTRSKHSLTTLPRPSAQPSNKTSTSSPCPGQSTSKKTKPPARSSKAPSSPPATEAS